MRVILIEDDEATRAGLRHWIDRIPGYTLAGEAGSFAAGLVLLDTPFDIVLIDVYLGDGSGIEIVACIRARFGDAPRILTISSLGDEATVVAALEAGADGYLLKDAGESALAQALVDVAGGHSPISPGVARHLLRRFRRPPGEGFEHAQGTAGPPLASGPDDGALPAIHLSPRETQILESLAQGMSYKETAAALEVSYHTVTDYVKTLYRKLKVSSRSKAVAVAARAGLIDLGPVNMAPTTLEPPSPDPVDGGPKRPRTHRTPQKT